MSTHAALNLIYRLGIVTPRAEKIRPSLLKPTVEDQKADHFKGLLLTITCKLSAIRSHSPDLFIVLLERSPKQLSCRSEKLHFARKLNRVHEKSKR